MFKHMNRIWNSEECEAEAAVYSVYPVNDKNGYIECCPDAVMPLAGVELPEITPKLRNTVIGG